MPAIQAGQGHCYIQAVSYSPGKGVRLMWRKAVIQALRVLLLAVLAMILLTTKAC